MNKPSIEKLKNAFVKKGYDLRKGEYELNIIGIRNNNSKPNSFDDLICVLFKDEYVDDTLLFFPATTDFTAFLGAALFLTVFFFW